MTVTNPVTQEKMMMTKMMIVKKKGVSMAVTQIPFQKKRITTRNRNKSLAKKNF